MKSLFLFILLFIIKNYSIASKEYTISIKVFSLGTKLPISGAVIKTKKGEIEIGKTNESGFLTIEGLKDKSISYVIIDPSGEHRDGSFYYYNPDRNKNNETKEVYLRWTPKHEEVVFKAIDEKYKVDAQQPYVNQIPSGKSSQSEKDSIEFTPAVAIGGLAEFHKFINRHLEYPQQCIEDNIQGKVYLSFIIQKDGVISDVLIVKGVNEFLDKEAQTLIRYCPNWIPAMSSEGKPVRSFVRTPINFSLN